MQIFLLYTLAAPEADRVGLGQVNDRADYLEIEFDLNDTARLPTVRQCELEDHTRLTETTRGNGKETAKKSTLRISLRQSVTSLKSVAGDTGSVVWRSSLHLAGKVLQDISRFAEIERVGRCDPNRQETFLISPGTLSELHVVELGAGTGVVPVAILSHPRIAQRRGSWTATDQASLAGLLRKNLQQSDCQVETVDWLEASQIYRSGAPSAKARFLKDFQQSDGSGLDLILATDCIFNPSLFLPFLDTLTLLTVERCTCVMIVCELRQSDALHDFLAAWLAHEGRWRIYTVEAKDVLGPRLTRGCVVWLAWRS